MLKNDFNDRLASMGVMERSQATESSSQEHSIQFTLLPTCREEADVATAIWEEFVFLLNCRR